PHDMNAFVAGDLVFVDAAGAAAELNAFVEPERARTRAADRQPGRPLVAQRVLERVIHRLGAHQLALGFTELAVLGTQFRLDEIAAAAAPGGAGERQGQKPDCEAPGHRCRSKMMNHGGTWSMTND